MFENIAKTILQISLMSAAAIFLVMIIRAVFGSKLKTGLMCVLWMVVLMRLLLPITFNSPVQLGNIFGFAEASFERATAQDNEAASLNEGVNASGSAVFDEGLTDKPNTENTAQMPIDTAPALNTVQIAEQVNPWHVALAIWLAGMVGFLIVNVYRMLAFRRKVNSGKTLDTPAIKRLVSSNKAKLGLSQNISVMECRYINVPAVTGLKQPMILLPTGLSDAIDLGKLDMIILHEMCHIKRKDLAVNFVWLIARALHWFNPLIWFAYKAYLDDIERACDETALKNLSIDGVSEYSQALVETVKFAKRGKSVPVLLSFCKDKSKIRKRVINMMKPRKKSVSVSIIAILAMVIILLGCFTTACTSADEQISITEPTPEAIVQPDDASGAEANEEDSADETIPEETPVVPEEQSGISEEVLHVLKSFAINNEQTFELDQSEDYFGDKILFFYADMTSYQLFESDLSLRSLGTKIHDFNLPIEISEEEAKTVVISYAKKYWPDFEPEITKIKYEEDESFKLISIEGMLKDSRDQSEQVFRGTVNGKGELISIGRTPNIDIEQCIADGTALTLEQAKEYAYEYLNENKPIVKMDNLKTVSEKLDDSGEIFSDPQYIFEFEYRSDSPTADDFDYDAYVVSNPSTGDFSSIRIDPILDNIDIISMEEAEQIAKEYIVSNFNQELEDITATYKQIDTFSGMIFYSFCFDYGEDDGCSITISAETGEIDGIGF